MLCIHYHITQRNSNMENVIMRIGSSTVVLMSHNSYKILTLAALLQFIGRRFIETFALYSRISSGDPKNEEIQIYKLNQMEAFDLQSIFKS